MIAWDTLRRVWPYTRPFKRKLWIIGVGSILFGALKLVDPYIYRIITDEVFVKALVSGIGAREAFRIIGLSCAALLAAHVVTSAIGAAYSYLSLEVSQRMEAQMFHDALAHLQRLDMGFHYNTNSGEVLSKVERGIDSLVRMIHENLAKSFLPGVINILCIFGWIFYRDWRLALAATVFIPLHVYIAFRKAKPIYAEQSEINKAYERIYHRAYEGISNVEAVQSFNASPQELALFSREREGALVRQLKIGKWWRVLGVYASLFNALGIVSVIGVGSWLIIRGEITTGEIIMFLAYVGMLYQPLTDMVNRYLEAQEALSRIRRFSNLLGIQPKISGGALAMPPVRRAIRFERVSFAYDGSGAALSDITLEIPAGKKVALVGPTGAGKSTLINLIQRYYDPTAGVVTFDGTDIRNFTLESLRSEIAVVPQSALLFSRSVAENIAYGKPDAAEADIKKAAEAANAHEFIAKKPNGYDTRIGENGVKLSGGEQQRISIARAVLWGGSVIILDEATSHLDSNTEHLVQDALWRLMGGKTAIMIAHRLSTVLGADLIIVMDDGRVRDQGTHAELLTRCDLYRGLYERQFGDAPAE